MIRPINTLLYLGQYNLSDMTSAPKIRTYQLYLELARQVETIFITGWRQERRWPLLKFLLGGGLNKVDAIYLEAASSTAMETDLLLLLLARLKRIPIGIYIRDAYPLFEMTETATLKGKLLYWGWQISHWCYKALASVIFFQSRNFAQFFKPLTFDWELLPPGGRALEFKPLKPERKVCLYSGGISDIYGSKTLLEAMELVWQQAPEAELWLVCRRHEIEVLTDYLDRPWLRVLHLEYDQVAELRGDIYLTVIPMRKNQYSDAVLGIKFWDYMALGRAIVCSNCEEMAAIVSEQGLGPIHDTSPADLAAKILALFADPTAAERYARNAHHYLQTQALWKHRAETILTSLSQRLPSGRRPEGPSPSEQAAQHPKAK